MAKISINENLLNVSLDRNDTNILIPRFLKRKGFKEQNLVWVSRKHDAETIQNIQKYFVNHNVELELDDGCQQTLQIFETTQENFSNLLQEASEIKNRPDEEFEDIVIPEFNGHSLYPFQIKPVLHGLKLKNSANFSVPGSGKTWMALATYFLAKHGKEFPNVNRLLVVCPIAAFQVWEEEYRTVTGKSSEDNIIRLTSKHLEDGLIPLLPEGKEIILINYEKIGNYNFHAALQLMLQNHDFFMILDESHKIMTYDSGRGEGARELSEYAKRKMILTGTPMPNYHKGLWNQFNFLFPEKKILQDYEVFSQRIKNNPVEQRRVEEELFPYFTRITDNQLNLPGITTNIISCPMDKHQQEIYEIIAWQIASNASNQSQFNAYEDYENNIMYWIMAATDPSLLSENNQYTNQLIDLGDVDFKHKIEEYGRGELSGKLSVLKEFLNTILNKPKPEKIIIWCNFRGTLKKIQQMIEDEFQLEVRKIDGTIKGDGNETKEAIKERSIKEFKTRDDVNILIANPASLAEAISLHKVCHHAIYVDRTFVATNWIQSKKRIHRIGMDDVPTTYTILMSSYGLNDRRKTVDDVIEISLERKEKALNKFLNDPGINNNDMDLNYEKIDDVESVEDDYRSVIEFLQRKFKNDQNN